MCPPETCLSDFEGFGVVYKLLHDCLGIKEQQRSSFYHCLKKAEEHLKSITGKIIKEEYLQLEKPAESLKKSYILKAEFPLI